jgi:hypothetical protein
MAAMLVIATGIAAATDYPVSGSLTVNGNVAPLPDGGAFVGSGYDPASGAIAEGSFVFPQTTFSFDTPLGTAVATYVLDQTDSSTGTVWADATAALMPASFSLTVLSLTVGIFPVDVGTCVLGPIVIELAGTASAGGLALGDDGFEIPALAADACGGYGEEINEAIAGTNNQAAVDLAGDFTPPADADTVFANGFDPP